MICKFQRTIKSPVYIKGIGLHSGKEVEIKLLPANENEGINFIKDNVVVPAKIDFAHSFDYSTALFKDGINIKTVEHLMAALYFTGIDNIFIEINEEELPILDGSSKEYVEKIKEAGINSLKEEKFYAVLEETVNVELEDKFIKAKPSVNTKITYKANYNNQVIRDREYTYIAKNKDSYKGVYIARTYCFLDEVEYLRKNGLAKGGSLKNAVVLHNDKVINAEGLRFEDEPVRHKVLDLIGDLYLLGYPLIAEIFSFKGGHRLNGMFVKTLVNNSLFSIKTASEILENMEKENIKDFILVD